MSITENHSISVGCIYQLNVQIMYHRIIPTCYQNVSNVSNVSKITVTSAEKIKVPKCLYCDFG